MNGDVRKLRRILDSGKVHVDCRDKVSENTLTIAFSLIIISESKFFVCEIKS